MNRVLAYLLRFAVVVLGYVAAALAASIFIHILYLGGLGWTGEEAPLVITASLIFSIPFVALFAAYLAFMPALVVILVAELFGRRDWLTYAVGGGIVAAAVVGMMSQFETAPDPVSRNPSFILLMLGAGFVGGTAYWMAAGRFAGNLTSPGPSGS